MNNVHLNKEVVRQAAFCFLIGIVPAISIVQGAVSCQGKGLGPNLPVEVVQYQPYEAALLPAKLPANPYIDGPEISADFVAPSKKTYTIRAFSDGSLFRLRFAPNEVGSWSIKVNAATDPCLNSQPASFHVHAPSTYELATNRLLHGFVKAAGSRLVFSDGTPLGGFGDSQFGAAEIFTNADFATWMKVLASAGGTSVLFSDFLGLYDTVPNTPFAKADPSSDVLNQSWFADLDTKIAAANAAGIHVRLMLGGFPGNTNATHKPWFERFGSAAQAPARIDRWFHYVVSRYSGYNVSWVLFGETDEKLAPTYSKLSDEVSHFAAIVDAEDPWDRPIGVHLSKYISDSYHPARAPYTTSSAIYKSVAGVSRVDYVSLQLDSSDARTETQYKAVDEVTAGKPVLVDEFAYEAFEEYKKLSDSAERGIRNTYRNALRNGYPTIGSLMRNNPGSDFAPKAASNAKLTLEAYLQQKDFLLARLQNFAALFNSLDTGSFKKETTISADNVAAQFGSALVLFGNGAGNRKMPLDLSKHSGSFYALSLEVQQGACFVLPMVKADKKGEATVDLLTSKDAVLVLSPTALSCTPYHLTF